MPAAEAELGGLCARCLALHPADAETLARGVRGKVASTVYCSDELAFPAIAVHGVAPCACGGTTVLALPRAEAESVARYAASRSAPERSEP